jgi:hypothetical protein
MKRLLLSVFAAAITAAWVVPAPAAASDITLSGQYRLRGEYRSNPNFTSNNSNSLLDQRIRLTAKAQATDDVSVKITLQDSRRWGINAGTQDSGPSLTDNGVANHLDLHESYLAVKDVLGTGVNTKIGRQKLVLGDQRLVGAFDWHNNARTFDAFRFDYGGIEQADLLLVASKVAEANAGDGDQDFYVAQATVKNIPNNTVDVYVMLLRDGSTTPMVSNATTIGGTLSSAQSLYTYGARVKGMFNAIDYTGEVAFQSGGFDTTTATYDISALAYALKAGYTLPTAMKTRVGAQYLHADGDSDASDTDIETFSNLFPTNHLHMGYMDRQGWRNVDAWSVDASAQVNEKLNVKAAWWSFKLAEQEDGWYGAGNWNNTVTGTLRAANSANTEDEIGSELDIIATYKYNSAITAQAGIARFFTGTLVDNRVADEEDQDWAYLQLVANF